MFYRVTAVAICLTLLVGSAIAHPPKKLHYDGPSLDSESFYEPVEGSHPVPEMAPDPIAATRELACAPVVVRGFIQAWKSTLNGTRDNGLAEAGFAIQRYAGSISVQGWSEAALNGLLIQANADTIAIAHVHGRGADEHPAEIDARSRVPNFVISRTALYVTISGTARYLFVRGGVDSSDGWNKPCRSLTQSVTAQR